MTCALLLQAMAALALRLLTFRRWGDEMPYARRFFVAFGFLLLELSIENFFIWCAGTTLLCVCCLMQLSFDTTCSHDALLPGGASLVHATSSWCSIRGTI